MQHELPQIENDREALVWAGGCLIASYVERGRAITRQQAAIGLTAFLALGAIAAASWWAGQRPYLTPGNHQIFREDSELGAIAGFFVFIAAVPTGLFALMLWINDRKFHQAARAGRVCAAIAVPYLGALTLTSLLTPATIVNIGDRYCMDIWCIGVNQVNAAQQGKDILYTANVGISVFSSHSHHFPAEQAQDFFYVVDDQGRRYPLLRDVSFGDTNVTVNPGESVASSVAFRAPQDARKLYLAGNDDGEVHLPWVYLYFGSDISLFHRHALLRIL
jgi:hypothetical protein